MVDLFNEDTLNESSSSEKKSIEAVKFETDNQPLFKQVERVLGQGEKKGIDAKGIFINFLKNGGFTIDESGVPFPLLDGTEAVFDLIIVESDKIEELTDVHPSNERDPDALTAESLQDIIPTLSKKGNLYPAIANKNPDSGKLEFMDGSRRRMSCIIDKKPLRVYVARESISLADAQYISKVSRKQKAHSYYELGLRHLKEFNRLDSEGGRLYPDKKDLAAYLFGEKYTDSDYQTLLLQLKFAEIPQSLISVIPDYNGLSVSKYNEVAKVFKTIQAHSISKSLPIKDVISGYLKKIDGLVLVISQDTKLGTKKKQSGIIKILKENWAEFSEADIAPKKETTPLKKFNDRNKVARKVVTKHFTNFEFKRISEDKITKIEAYILEQLQDEK